MDDKSCLGAETLLTKDVCKKLSLLEIVLSQGFDYTERLWIFFFTENHVIKEIFKLFLCQYLLY